MEIAQGCCKSERASGGLEHATKPQRRHFVTTQTPVFLVYLPASCPLQRLTLVPSLLCILVAIPFDFLARRKTDPLQLGFLDYICKWPFLGSCTTSSICGSQNGRLAETRSQPPLLPDCTFSLCTREQAICKKSFICDLLNPLRAHTPCQNPADSFPASHYVAHTTASNSTPWPLHHPPTCH